MAIDDNLNLQKEFYEIIRVNQGVCDFCGEGFKGEAIRLKNFGQHINGTCYDKSECVNQILDMHYDMPSQVYVQ